MANSHLSPEIKTDASIRSDHETPPGMPKWVKVSGIIIIVFILVGAVLLLSGGHGPGRHMQPVSTTQEHTMPMGATEQHP